MFFFGSSKLRLYFEEWLLQRPALRSTWACVTHMKNLASLLTLGFVVVVVVVYVWSHILSYWFLLYKRQDWSWEITKSSKGIKEVNLGLFLFHWDETNEELFCSSRNQLQVEEEIKTTKYLTFFFIFRFFVFCFFWNKKKDRMDGWFHLGDLVSFKEWLEDLISGHKESKCCKRKKRGDE